MTDVAKKRMRRHRALWRLMNPAVRAVAGSVPWWVLIETTGRRTGQLRRTPVATGPTDGSGMWLIAVHGTRAAWVRNLQANPAVRIRHHRSWHAGTATVHPLSKERLATFNRYARGAPRTFGVDPVFVQVTFG